MNRGFILVGTVFLGIFIAAVARAADPPAFLNPFKGMTRSPFTAEVEVYSGGISGDSVGAAFKSATQGGYGGRFTFGFMKALNFSVNYLYSNQTRSFSAATPAVGSLPTGTAIMHAGNLHMAWGSGEISLVRVGRSSMYLSPGIGLARNGSRNMTLVTPLGTASAPILAGRSVSFNLGAGVKIFPAKHWGFRIDLRDFVSGGGTGNLNPTSNACVAIYPPPPECAIFTNTQQYFGPIPVQNNVVLTLGLIFKII